MFYTNYVKLCNSINQSPSSVSETLGFKRSVVTRWKNGSVPREATLQKIADFFNITVEELLSDIKKEPATVSGDKLIPGYSDLSEENKLKAREYIALLLNSQCNE